MRDMEDKIQCSPLYKPRPSSMRSRPSHLAPSMRSTNYYQKCDFPGTFLSFAWFVYGHSPFVIPISQRKGRLRTPYGVRDDARDAGGQILLNFLNRVRHAQILDRLMLRERCSIQADTNGIASGGMGTRKAERSRIKDNWLPPYSGDLSWIKSAQC